MTRASALLDAAMTVDCWMQETDSRVRYRVRRRVARELGCAPIWREIRNAIVRRLLAEAAA